MDAQPSIRLTAVEESILLWERASVPWAIQYGIAAPRLEGERVREAFNDALARHESGRWGLTEGPRGVHWTPTASAVDIGPVDVVPCPDEEARRSLGDRLVDAPMPLDRAPLWRAAIARGRHGDVLVASHSHVVTDGIGGLRLLQSVARSYAGSADPPPLLDAVAARRTLARAAPSGVEGLVRRWADGLQVAATAVLPRVRVAARGGGGAGFGTVVTTVDVAELDAARDRLGASFDELLVAALHVAIARWNLEAGVADGRIGTALGVNLRPSPWVRDVVATLATFVSVVSEPGQRTDLATALAHTRPQITTETRFERARLVAEASRAGALLPFDLRRQTLAALAPERFDSIAMSNLGTLPDPLSFAPGYDAEVWVSPPAVPVVGLGIAVLTSGGRTRICLRFRRKRFDDDGARAFADAYAECLVGA